MRLKLRHMPDAVTAAGLSSSGPATGALTETRPPERRTGNETATLLLVVKT
jgi:hypothetical protein